MILALVLAALLYVVAPAHAETTTSAALNAACPGHRDLAGPVDSAARRYLLHPLVLVAVMAHESGCDMRAVGAAGEVCAFQLRGAARNGHSSRALARDAALCVATGARWLALREVECGGLLLGLSGYNSRTCEGGKRYARAVLARLGRLWDALAARRRAALS